MAADITIDPVAIVDVNSTSGFAELPIFVPVIPATPLDVSGAGGGGEGGGEGGGDPRPESGLMFPR